ncbi:hypothetical protein K440DRAFT_661125 [Wilcoxina mikolae CBS 423.85]|nr:hypothetical protein K440DRAFT_661125 [Wilcoxina mikolae CBS 423.85]
MNSRNNSHYWAFSSIRYSSNEWTLELSKEWWRGEYQTEQQRTVPRQPFPVRPRSILAPQLTLSSPHSSPQLPRDLQPVPLPLYSYSRPPSYRSSHDQPRPDISYDLLGVDTFHRDSGLSDPYPQRSIEVDPAFVTAEDANYEVRHLYPALPQPEDSRHNGREAGLRIWVPPTREDLPQMTYLDELPLWISSGGEERGVPNPETKRRKLRQRLWRAVRIILWRGDEHGDRGNSEEKEEAERKRALPSWMDWWE